MNKNYEKYSKNCRGFNKKRNIAINYIVEPQFALVLLPGQKFYNCCDKQFKEYQPNSIIKLYVFDIENKKNHYRQTLIMGEHCAKDLIKIYNDINPTDTITLPKITNIFNQKISYTKNDNQNNDVNNMHYSYQRLDRLNNLLLKAIYIVIFLHWNGKYLSPAITEIIREINKNPSIPYDKGIKHFFKRVLPKDESHFEGDLIEIYNNIKNKFPSIQKNIKFEELIDYYKRIEQ